MTDVSALGWLSATTRDLAPTARRARTLANAYAIGAIDAAIEVLGAFPHDYPTALLASAFLEEQTCLSGLAPRDGAIVGWTRALVDAAIRGGPSVAKWSRLLEYGAIFVATAAVARSPAAKRLPLAIPPEGCSLHAIGRRLVPDDQGSVRDGRNTFRCELLHQVPIAGDSIVIDGRHTPVIDLLLADYQFPNDTSSAPLSEFPYSDPLHECNIEDLREGASIIDKAWQDGGILVACFGRSFMPITSPSPGENVSVSASGFPGWIVASLDIPLYMAECLIHEASHNLLYELMREDPLLLPEASSARWYSPWRPDPRPLEGLLHACYVFNNIMTLYGQIADGGSTAQHALRARARLGAELRRVSIALDTLEESAHTTPAGREFLRAIRTTATRWEHSDIVYLTPDDRDAIDQHRTVWMATHSTGRR